MVVTACFCAALKAAGAPPADEPAKQIAAEAAALGRAWDDAASRLGELARARRLPAPAVADLTLVRAMRGLDLRTQLLHWNGRYLCGRAWIANVDGIVRPVWVLAESPATDGLALRLAVPVLDVLAEGPLREELRPVEVTLAGDAARITGRYTMPGSEDGPLMSAIARGAVTGARRDLTAAAPPPSLRTREPADQDAARQLLVNAAGLMRLYRALDMVLSQGAAPADAWAAGSVVAPDFFAAQAAAKNKAKSKPPELPTLDLGLDLAGDRTVRPAAPKRPPPSDPTLKAKLAPVARLMGRMRAAAAAWAAAPAAPPAAPGAEEAAADSDFGPWYGHGSLAADANSPNVLPADAGAEGSQCWLFVRNWQFVGPFPANHPALVSWRLPEFFDAPDARYVTDIEALKRAGELDVPASPFVTWQRAGEQIELGLQRPWTDFQPSRFGGDLAYSGPLNGRTYARSEVLAPADVELWVAISASDYGRLWVNGRLVAAAVGDANAPEAEQRAAWGRASFRKGANTLVVRLDAVNTVVGSGAKRRPERRTVPNYFWVKVAVHGRPLDAAAAAARQAAVAARQARLDHLPPDVRGYRNNNTACYPDAAPVTAWDLETGRNVLWRTPLELESAGGYLSNANSSKAPPVVMGDRLIVLREPHFVCCLDKASGKVLWDRECSVFELVAPDKLDQSRKLWAEYVRARSELLKLGRDYVEREAALMKRGMTKDQARDEIRRLGKELAEKCGSGKRAGSTAFYDFLVEHGKLARSAYGGWTGYSFASPVTDGRRVWVKFGTGVAACFDRDGNRLWMTRIPAEGESTVCPSPLLVAGRFVVEVGAKSQRPGLSRFCWDWTRLIALDAATGRELWRTGPMFHPTATSSPAAVKLTDGRQDMDAIVTDGAALVRADDGKVLSQAWLVDAGQGTLTVADGAVYHPSESRLLTASRLVMYDRDSAGLRRLWSQPMPTAFDGGMAYADGLLYGSGGGQGAGGYVVFDTRSRDILRHEWPGHGDRSTVWRGMPPQSNGRQYVPITVAGGYVFIGEHGSAFHGRVARGAICGVVQRRPDGLLLGKSLVEKAWTAPPVFDGDRIYIRTDPSVICLARGDDAGRAYEADVNARYILGDLETQPPADTPPIDIAPSRPDAIGGATPFARFIAFPIEVFGYFDIARADDVLAALGGLTKAAEKGQPAPAVEVGGQTITRQFYGNCGMYGRVVLADNLHFRDVGPGKGAYFRAWLVNDRQRVVRVWAPQEPPDVWIAGRRVPEGTRVRLQPGTYALVARAYNTEQWPAAPGFYFRLDDSSDVAAERKAWLDTLRASRGDLERIARWAHLPAHVAKAKKLLEALQAASGGVP